MALRSGLVLLGVYLVYIIQGSTGEESSVDGGQDKTIQDSHAQLYLLLLNFYHPLVIPTTPVNVTYGLQMNQIDGVDEAENILRISTYASISWYDHRFQWDPSMHNGINFVSLPADKIWKPDLRPFTGAHEFDDVNLRVHNNGFILHIIPLRLSIPCFFQFANYPFDSQTCKITVGSWGYDESMISLNLPEGSSGTSMDSFSAHTLWDVQSFTAEKMIKMYPCCEESYASLTFSIKMKRRPIGYTVRVLAPSVFTSLLILVCFLIPPTSGERIVLCSVLLLCVLLQLFHFNLSVPLSGSDSPYLGDFLCFSVFLAFFALIESVLSLNLTRGMRGDGNNDRHEGGGEFPGVQTKSTTALARVARIIDNGCFIIFTVIFAIVGGVILNPYTE